MKGCMRIFSLNLGISSHLLIPVFKSLMCLPFELMAIFLSSFPLKWSFFVVPRVLARLMEQSFPCMVFHRGRAPWFLFRVRASFHCCILPHDSKNFKCTSGFQLSFKWIPGHSEQGVLIYSNWSSSMWLVHLFYDLWSFPTIVDSKVTVFWMFFSMIMTA